MQDSLVATQVHRFHGHVAIYVHDGSQVYITPADARTLADALNACADDVKDQPNFCLSQFNPKQFQFEGKVS
jgi:hypothetical protein